VVFNVFEEKEEEETEAKRFLIPSCPSPAFTLLLLKLNPGETNSTFQCLNITHSQMSHLN